MATETDTQAVSYVEKTITVKLTADDLSELEHWISRPGSISLEELASELLSHRAASIRFNRKEAGRRRKVHG
jgi:hypothetical protein